MFARITSSKDKFQDEYSAKAAVADNSLEECFQAAIDATGEQYGTQDILSKRLVAAASTALPSQRNSHIFYPVSKAVLQRYRKT
eukprot:scaffold24115_cov112-Skeletonema_dohrnii-CCMP3373.AAC.1